MAVESIPKVEVQVVRTTSGVWDLIVLKCPYCGKQHRHGGGDGEKPNLGFRATHCVGDRGRGQTYQLVDAFNV